MKSTNMKSFPALLSLMIISCVLMGCSTGPSKPDVSKIKVKLVTKRFEKEFFSLDSATVESGLNALQEKYPDFLNGFIYKILGLEGIDSSKIKPTIVQFIKDYRPLYDSSKTLDAEMIHISKEIEGSLKYVQYYFPKYPLPTEFITFVGPIDAFAYGETGGYGEIITPNAVCSGLQLHLGSNSMVYHSETGLQLYPAYISRRFSAEYISINCIKNIIDDVYPPKNQARGLVEIMIEQGKRMYLLDLFMPDAKEELKLGYTEDQLKQAKENEGLIWNYFTENNLLYETDPLKIRSYVSDGPSTAEFGEASPGFISLFIGKQIVYAYLKKNPDANINSLLSLDARKILSGSSYKPK
jgi:hypothetical protein